MSNPPENNLTTKFTALQTLMTTQHQETLTAIWGLAGPAPGTNLTQIAALLTKISNGIGGYPDGATLPGGLEILSAREYLSQINNSASFLSLILDSTGYSGSDTIISTLKLLLEQFNTSVVYPTMKDLLMTISTQQATLVQSTVSPMLVVPYGICETPITSNGVGFVALGMSIGSFTFGAPVTVASWSTPPLPFYLTDDPQNGSYGICVDEWSNWRIYVASTALKFAVLVGAAQRFNTNEWVTLSGNQIFRFYVDGEEDIKVYICGASAPPALNADPGGCQSGIVYEARMSFDATGVDQVLNGTTWSIYHALFETVPGYIVATSDGQVVSLDPTWAAANPGSYVQLCITWNFDAGTVAPQYEVAWDEYDEGAVRNAYISQPMVGPTGMVQINLYSSRPTLMNAIYVGGVPGAGIPSNMFIHVIPVTGLS
jgi:hypothetical protein